MLFEIAMEHLPEETEYHQKLKSLLATTKLRSKQIIEYGLRTPVEDFMDEIGTLYLSYFQFHKEEAKICAIDCQELLCSLIKVINFKYVYEIRRCLNSTSEHCDETWETACLARTNIEAFHEMFGNIAGYLDSEIEEYIQDRKGTIRADRNLIPAHMPTTHWWRFADFEFKE